MNDKFKKFGSFPFESEFSKMIFMSKEKEKEWEEMDESLKRSITRNLKETCSKMENKMAIELLCHVINDMGKRISELESKNE